jgi:hypothetical protein
MEYQKAILKFKSNAQGDFIEELPRGRYCLRAVYDSTGKPLTVSPKQYTLLDVNRKSETRFDVMIEKDGAVRAVEISNYIPTNLINTDIVKVKRSKEVSSGPAVPLNSLAKTTVHDNNQKQQTAVVSGLTYSAPQIFELNKDYILQTAFDRFGQITQTIVVPKYYAEECEPSWTEPDYVVGLTEKESREVLARVNEPNNLGSLVSLGKAGIVTNSKLWLVDRYQSAFVQRVLNYAEDPAANTIHALSVFFIRDVSGTVEDKQLVDQFAMDKQFKLKIDGSWYFATETGFQSARVGSHTVVQAAGPIGLPTLCPLGVDHTSDTSRQP